MSKQLRFRKPDAKVDGPDSLKYRDEAEALRCGARGQRQHHRQGGDPSLLSL